LRFSVVVPIHNEEKYLPYSLPAIYRLEPDEVILIFDRCKDGSVRIAKEISQSFGYKPYTRFVELDKPSPDWNFRVAFLRRYGYMLARNDIILNTDADMVLDNDVVKNHMTNVGRNGIGLVSFGYLDYPYTIQCFIRKIISTLSPITGFAGQYAFSKRAWLETEDEESVKKVYKSEDTHLRLSLLKKYGSLHINTNSLHLRPTENNRMHYMRGVAYWEVVHNPAWKMLLHSIICLRPAAMAGYINARSRGVMK